MQRTVDPILGDVVLDGGLWVAQVEYGARSVSVYLMVDEGEDPARWITLARAAVQQLNAHVPAALEAVGVGLVELANDWREDDARPEFTAADLSAMFKLVALTVFEGGTTEFSFDDADVFAGHEVVVDLRPDGNFDNARIEG
jgi:hypothetical protein